MKTGATVFPAPQSVAAATLDRRYLHVFVAGPGLGEAIAIALPTAGWILLDGCEVSGPAGREATSLKLVTNLRMEDEPVELAVLTHPHDDHAQGFAKTLEALAPRRLMVTSRSPAGPHLYEIAKCLYEEQCTTAASTRIHDNAPVVSALRAIERWTRVTKKPLTAGVAGSTLSLGEVQVTVCAPHQGPDLDRVLRKLAQGDRSEANHASVVLELTWGDARLVFGGDLPTLLPQRRGQPARTVPTGWQAVMGRSPHLAEHRFLKVPHHGSAEAHDATLMHRSTNAAARGWALTPFARGRKRIPSLEANALPRLIGWEPALHVTAPLPSWIFDAPPDGRVPLSEIRIASPSPTGDPFADDADDITPMPQHALDPVWGFAFDRHGAIVSRWRGDRAIEIQASATPQASALG